MFLRAIHGTGPIGLLKLNMGLVPWTSYRHTWDQIFFPNGPIGHRKSLAAIHGTGPIGLSEPYMGPHVSN